MDPEDVPHGEFVQWAERNDLVVIQDGRDGENRQTKHKNATVVTTEDRNGGVEIILTEYGNIHLIRHRHLGGEAGSIEIGEKQVRVKRSDGREYRVTSKSYPI